jgi:two-component system, LuxR family, sensor kinase FixL
MILELYAEIFQHLPMGVMIWELPDLNDTSTFRLIEVNAIARQMLGILPDAELHSALSELQLADDHPFPPFLQIESPERYADVIRSAEAIDLGEIRYRQPQQAEKVFLVKAFPLPKQRMGAVFEDVSDRSHLAAALQQSEQKLVFHAQHTPLAVIEWNTDLEIVEWNPAAEKMFGYSKRDAIGYRAIDLIVPSHMKLKTEQLWQQIHQRKTGMSRTAETMTHSGEILICEWHSTPLIDADAEVIGTTSLVQNVTERKHAEAELKQFTARLEQSNRELQDFASIASHDLQEPLRKIQAFGDRLRQKYYETLTVEGRDYLERMQNAAQRMQALIHDLLTFSRVTTQAQPFTSTNLNQIVQEVLSDLEVRIQQVNGQIQVAPLHTIDADPTQMRQLLQNLISNALKFHQPDLPPVVQIQTQLVSVLPESAASEPAQLCCQITVSDNGIGFEEKYLDRIFTVFQRLHSRSEYEGTGVGLAICRKIVERHNGTITAHSIPNQGTCFVVTLPVQQLH